MAVYEWFVIVLLAILTLVLVAVFVSSNPEIDDGLDDGLGRFGFALLVAWLGAALWWLAH